MDTSPSSFSAPSVLFSRLIIFPSCSGCFTAAAQLPLPLPSSRPSPPSLPPPFSSSSNPLLLISSSSLSPSYPPLLPPAAFLNLAHKHKDGAVKPSSLWWPVEVVLTDVSFDGRLEILYLFVTSGFCSFFPPPLRSPLLALAI